jgi:adenylate cyclase
MARLILIHPDGQRLEYTLGQSTSIGRHPDNAIQILDKVVSKEHATVEKVGDRYVLRDLASRNGTFINQKRITGEAALRDQDEVSLGSMRLLFVDDATSSGTPHFATIQDRVTIAPETQQGTTYIRTRFEAQREAVFLPEREIRDGELLRRDYEKLRVAYELNRAIGLEVDVEKLLHRILEMAFQFLPADRGVIMLQEGDQLLPKALKTRGRRAEEIIISHTIIETVVRQREAVLSSDARVDSRFGTAQSVIIQGIRSAMCVPILHNNNLYGILHLDTQDTTGAFTEKDLQLLTGIANQAAVSLENALLARKLEEEAASRAKFQRFLSPSLVEQVISGKLALKPGGELRECTVLFSDIRGYTSIAEKYEAQDVVAMLNEYFELLVDVVFKHEGTLDKYIGDSVMAVWGAPVHQPDAAIRAVSAALEMREVLARWNREREAQGRVPIFTGFGIDTGQVVAGNLGSSKTMEYTVIGDSVNLASRLTNLAQTDQIIISANTLDKVRDYVMTEALPATKIKGKEETIPLYNVTGFLEPAKDLYAPRL